MTDQRLAVFYPVSKMVRYFVGTVHTGELPDQHGSVFCVGVVPADEQQPIMVVDPRCVIADEKTHAVLYDPRDHVTSMPADMQVWMRKHPSWPSLSRLQKYGKPWTH